MDKMDTQQLIRHIHRSDLTALEKRYLEGLVEAQTSREGMRLIDADELELRKFTAAGSMSEYGRGWNGALAAVVENAPTIEAEPVRHGRWVHVDENEYSCSECGKHVCFEQNMDGSFVVYKLCPFCGARMRKENENE